MSSDSVHLPYGSIYKKPAPIILVNLFHNHAEVPALVYVDSGALYSVFKVDVAERLELEWSSGTRVWGTGIDGKRIPLYLHRVGLRVAEFQFTATVGFSDQLAIGFNLLGRHSIFDALQFCVNDRDGELTVSRL